MSLFFTSSISAEEIVEIPEGFQIATEEEKETYRIPGEPDIEFILVLNEESLPSNNSRAFIYDDELERVYKESFKSVAWIYRDGVYSLSIKPKNNMKKEISWRALEYTALHKNPYPSNPWMKALKTNPTSIKSMYNQYVCHVDFKAAVAIIKGEYVINIEPHKPDKGYWSFVKTGCN